MLSRVGYRTEYLKSDGIKRNIPSEMHNARSEKPYGQDPYPQDKPYPTYGNTLKLSPEEKNALIRESNYLCSQYTHGNNKPEAYQKMDKDGLLYFNNGQPAKDCNGNQRKLFKHEASVGNYFSTDKLSGTLRNDEPAVIKKITFIPRNGGNYNVTGLYAPPGEVIKVEISEKDLNKIKSVRFHIGPCLYNGQPNNIWDKREMNRMPVLLNTMEINLQNAELDKERGLFTGYIGSFLGGPIYVCNSSSTFTVTISGAVNYRHFIMGLTTKEEFQMLSKSSAPYFDLEVWELGVLHSGPKFNARNFSYEDLCSAATLWERISMVSTQVRRQGIVFLYDCFVAAGAAVAFPGRSSVNCPCNWMENALNYEAFVTNGCWGTIHEFNHNFQGYGFPGGGEVTNNALNLVSYTSFTKVSANRTYNEKDGEGGLSAWNAYTSSSWALRAAMEFKGGKMNQLVLYATLIHNIGQTNFITATHARNPKGCLIEHNLAGNTDMYYRSLCHSSGYDMTWYFDEIVNCAHSDALGSPSHASREEIKNMNLPMFVPVACVFQTGRSINDHKFITTEVPFLIKYDEDFPVDLNPYTIDGKTFKGGSIVVPQGFSYRIKNVSKPEFGSLTGGENNLYVYKPDRDHSRSGKILVTLEITKDDNAFKVNDVDLVLEFEQSREINKSILTRTYYLFDSNKFSTAKEAYEKNYEGHKEAIVEDNINPTQNSNTDMWVPSHPNNSVLEIRGKILIPVDGNYRFAIRGRPSTALYLSTDEGQTYQFSAEWNQKGKDYNFQPNNQSTYHDLLNMKKNQWVYFKEVLIVNWNMAFVGLGCGKLDSNNKVEIKYAVAYREDYDFSSHVTFTSPYLYRPHYTYNLAVIKNYNEKGKLIESSPFKGWDANQELSSLFDDDESNQIHNNKKENGYVSEQKPFFITVDLGVEITANQMIIYGSNRDINQYQPRDFKLLVGENLESLQEIISITDSKVENRNVVVNFDKQYKFRFYKFICTKTYEKISGYISFRCIKFNSFLVNIPKGSRISPNDDTIEFTGNWVNKQADSFFGRVRVGQKDASAKFAFNGTQFAVLGLMPQNEKFDVSVDGNKAEQMEIPQGSVDNLVFLSKQLPNGDHVVNIKCLGESNLESLVKWS